MTRWYGNHDDNNSASSSWLSSSWWSFFFFCYDDSDADGIPPPLLVLLQRVGLEMRCCHSPGPDRKNLPPPPTPNFTAGRRRRRRGLSSHLAERSPKMASSMDLLISPYYVPCIWKRSNTRLAFHSVCAAPRPPRRHHRFAAPEVPDVGKECAG